MTSSAAPRAHRRDGRCHSSGLNPPLLDACRVRPGQRGSYSGFEHLAFSIVKAEVREGAVDVAPEAGETCRIDKLTAANGGETADHSLMHPAAHALALEHGSVQD